MSFLNVVVVKPVRRSLAVLWLVALCTQPAGAQTFPVTEWGPRIMTRVLYNVIRDTMAVNRPGNPLSTGQPNNGPVGSPIFAPSIERRRENVARRIAALRTIDPAGAAIVARADRLRSARADPTKQAALFAQLQRAGTELRVDFEHMSATSQGFMPSDMVTPATKP